MDESTFAYIAKYRKALGVDSLLVFMGLIEQMGTENYTKVHLKGFAKYLGMQMPHVNRAIERLVLRGLIIKGDKIGRYRIYKLNHHLRNKGFSKHQDSANSLKAPSYLKLIHKHES